MTADDDDDDDADDRESSCSDDDDDDDDDDEEEEEEEEHKNDHDDDAASLVRQASKCLCPKFCPRAGPALAFARLLFHGCWEYLELVGLLCCKENNTC